MSNFLKSVSDFLKHEAEEKKGAAEEINQLKIESFVLCRPNRPDEAMIYFTGPDEFRLWRCDYVKGKLSSLTFDN
jgi:hypothetical protein